MICKKCGEQLQDNAKFCPKCGTVCDAADPVINNAEASNISAAGAERAVPRGFAAKKNIIIIIIAAVLLIGGGITAIAVVNSHSASSGVSDDLQLAERYLSEQNYEQAVIEFQKVLEIEPMNVEAYLGLADAYIGLGETDKAIEILQEGLEKTGDERIKDKLDALTKKPESSSSAVVSSSIPVSSTTASSSPSSSIAPDTSATASSSTVPEPAPQPSGTVTILGEEYDIAATTGLNLYFRDITDEQLKDIALELEKLTNLTFLNLEHNQIKDITPLAKLTNLTNLALSGNQISDITPLKKFTNLTDLYLSDNQISESSIEELRNQLPNCNIVF